MDISAIHWGEIAMWQRLRSLLRGIANNHSARHLPQEAPTTAQRQGETTEKLPDDSRQTELIAGDLKQASLEQVVENWLNAPLERQQRRLLLDHAELLTPEAESLLLTAVNEYSEIPDMAQELRDRMRLLEVARRAGASAEAITHTYVNLNGGLALDVPSWIEDIERQLPHISHTEGPHRSAAQRAALLRDALARLPEVRDLSDEVVAELNVWLWDALDDLVNATPDEQEEGLACLRTALAIYTFDRYPAQYARCQLCMGNSYQERIIGVRRENFEAAITCYREALRVYHPDTFPGSYALAENNLGNTYRNRIAGSRRDNVEEAIACYQRALKIYTLADFPDGYAMTQNNLGNTLLIRMNGKRRDDLEAAIQCYLNALRVYTKDDAPRDYSMLQVGLGTVYRERIEGSEADNLETAIRYYETALQVSTPQSDPVRYAQVQMNLGGVYHERLLGNRQENLEKSLSYYARALEYYPRETQPTGFAMTHMGMANTYRDRIAGERSDNLEQAVRSYEAALEIYTPEAFPLQHRNVACALAATFWRDIALDAEQREQWETAQYAYTRAHAAYLTARHIQAELGWIETDEQGRARLRGSTGGAREMYARDAWCLWRLGDAQGALVALESGRAQALAEAQSLAEVATHQLCEEHSEEFRVASAEYKVARQTEDRNMLREARDRLGAVRKAIHAHCDADFLPNEPTFATINHAAADAQALIYIAATDRGGLLGVVLPELVDSRVTDNQSRAHILDLPEFTSSAIDDWLLRTDTHGIILGGLQVAFKHEGRRVLRNWLEMVDRPDAVAGNQRSALTLEDVVTQLPTNLSTVREAVEHVLDTCHSEAERWSLAGHVTRARNWQARATTSVGVVLHANWFSSLFDWNFQRSELDAVLPSLSHTVMRPLRELLDRLDLGLATQQVALIPCGRVGALPLHAAFVTAAETQNEAPFQETCALSYQASARALRAARTQANQLPANGPVIMIGDPQPSTRPSLTWARIEAEAIARLARDSWRSDSEALVAADATYSNVMKLLDWIQTEERGAWVGIASHGHADPSDPHKCFMLLAEDKRLTVADLQRLRLLDGVRLFDASGCVTALGDLETAPDELGSFAAGVLQAGAAGVLATQWAVSDRAIMLLMLRFAQDWIEHSWRSPTESLRAAATWLRQATRADIEVFAQSALDTSMIGDAISLSSLTAPARGDTMDAGVRGLDSQGILDLSQPISSLEDTAEDTETQPEILARADGSSASEEAFAERPYAHPIYWAPVIAYGV